VPKYFQGGILIKVLIRHWRLLGLYCTIGGEIVIKIPTIYYILFQPSKRGWSSHARTSKVKSYSTVIFNKILTKYCISRAVAKDLGLPYYESSVLTYFGVNQVILGNFFIPLKLSSFNSTNIGFWECNKSSFVCP